MSVDVGCVVGVGVGVAVVGSFVSWFRQGLMWAFGLLIVWVSTLLVVSVLCPVLVLVILLAAVCLTLPLARAALLMLCGVVTSVCSGGRLLSSGRTSVV